MSRKKIKKVSAMQLRNNLGEIMNSVSLRENKFIIERAGKPLVMITPIEEIGINNKKEFTNFEMSDNIDMTEIIANSNAFDFLKDEPDLYSEKDIIKN